MSIENKEKLKALYQARRAELEKDPIEDALIECADLIKLYAKDKIKLQAIADDLSQAYGFKITANRVNEFIKKNRLVRIRKKKNTNSRQTEQTKTVQKTDVREKTLTCPKCGGEIKLVPAQYGAFKTYIYKCAKCDTTFARLKDNSVGDAIQPIQP